jgi:hypothetical protein
MFPEERSGRRPGAPVLRVLGIGLVLTGSSLPSRVEAGFIPNFCGNTAPDNTAKDGLVLSTVNFAVLDTTGGGAFDTYGTKWGNLNFDTTFNAASGSPSTLNQGAEYLYLYQVSNDWPAISPNYITAVSIQLKVPQSDIKSWGWFPGMGLSNIAGPVTSDNEFGNKWTPGNPADADIGVSRPGITSPANESYLSPSSVSIDPRNRVFNIRWESGTFIAEQVSSLIGFTTNDAPQLLGVNVSGRATGQLPSIAAGQVPSPKAAANPEPASRVLLGTGLLLALMFSRFRGCGRPRPAST